eukprot:TRINITY_DN5256_c0_g1_i1.p1 TRINITY_DN5256_c0_g1~~TRINITY_DN5256_c0_g1_i1.p1  ORF type:complete len:168 (+),score=8.45 TRINITY_DN5256_c0_g1_i1:683-1186(+)
MLGALSLCFPYSLITNLRSAVEEFPGDQTKGIHKAICTTSTLQWHRPRLDFFDSFLLMFFRRSFQGSLLNYLYRHFSSDFESAVLKKNDFHHTLPLIEFLLEKNCFWNERHVCVVVVIVIVIVIVAAADVVAVVVIVVLVIAVIVLVGKSVMLATASPTFNYCCRHL